MKTNALPCGRIILGRCVRDHAPYQLDCFGRDKRVPQTVAQRRGSRSVATVFTRRGDNGGARPPGEPSNKGIWLAGTVRVILKRTRRSASLPLGKLNRFALNGEMVKWTRCRKATRVSLPRMSRAELRRYICRQCHKSTFLSVLGVWEAWRNGIPCLRNSETPRSESKVRPCRNGHDGARPSPCSWHSRNSDLKTNALPLLGWHVAPLCVLSGSA